MVTIAVRNLQSFLPSVSDILTNSGYACTTCMLIKYHKVLQIAAVNTSKLLARRAQKEIYFF
jgi:hypothetical protein